MGLKWQQSKQLKNIDFCMCIDLKEFTCLIDIRLIPHLQLNWSSNVALMKFLFTGRNEVVAKVMFLHMSVILLTGGVSGEPPQDQADPPPAGRTPPDQADHPPGRENP